MSTQNYRVGIRGRPRNVSEWPSFINDPICAGAALNNPIRIEVRVNIIDDPDQNVKDWNAIYNQYDEFYEWADITRQPSETVYGARVVLAESMSMLTFLTLKYPLLTIRKIQ